MGNKSYLDLYSLCLSYKTMNYFKKNSKLSIDDLLKNEKKILKINELIQKDICFLSKIIKFYNIKTIFSTGDSDLKSRILIESLKKNHGEFIAVSHGYITDSALV